MDATIANVATPSIHTRLHASGAELELVIGGYLISYAMLLVTGARLGQTHGYRRVFVAGLSTFTAASLVAGLAPTPLVLIAARVVQGAGGALMFPQTLTASSCTSPARSGSARSPATRSRCHRVPWPDSCSAACSCRPISSAAGGGRSSSSTSPAVAAVIAAALRFMPDDGQRAGREVDLRGVGTLSVAVLLVVLPLVLGPYQGWPAWTWACLLAEPAGAGAVRRHRAPSGIGRTGLRCSTSPCWPSRRCRWGSS